jgi:hypothetical protein
MVSQDDAVLDFLISQYKEPTHDATMMLKNALKVSGSCFIIVDAVDECPNKSTLPLTLLKIARDIPFGVKVLCSCDNNYDFYAGLSTLHAIFHIRISPDVIKRDIWMIDS